MKRDSMTLACVVALSALASVAAADGFGQTRQLSFYPWAEAHTVKHVPPQRVALGQQGMLEVLGGITPHPEALHHGPGARVRRHGDRYDLVERELAEGVVEAGAGRFGDIALAPVLARKAPADFDGGREVGLEGAVQEPYEARKGRNPWQLDGEEAVAVALEVGV